MEYKDYYKSLGVSRNASQDEIRDAFRKLARKYHPDTNKDDKTAEENFKLINEAYQVLSDPDKRKKYDQFGANWEQYARAGGQPEDFDWGQWSARPGSSTRINLEDLQDILGGGLGGMGGGGGFSDFFETLFGGARGGARRPQAAQNVEQEVEVTLEEAFAGATRIFQGTDGSRFEVSIPKGVKTGSKVRIAGKGGGRGDLFLKIRVKPHSSFQREGNNLRVNVSVDLYSALLGGEVSVPTMGRPVILTIKAGAQNSQTIRLRGKGMPDLRKKDVRGDLLVSLDVQLPSELNDEEIELFEKLRKLR